MNTSTELQVPVLTTALSGALLSLEKKILDKQTDIEAWLRDQWKKTPAPIYGSVDLRNAGYKLAPVDMNLYPAGFNNLNPEFLPLGIQATQMALEKRFSGIKNILIVAESHTRNMFYWENVNTLVKIISQAGYHVRVGVFPDVMSEPTTFTLPSQKTIHIEPIERDGNNIILSNFEPDILWLNNDLSAGVPELLQGISQPICPPLALGWHQRLKSVHFHHYQQVAQAFANHIDIDPWLIDPLFQYCGKVDFMKREGEECLAYNVDKLLNEIKKKHEAYNIDQDPFVVVKADSGTYGMSVMTVKSADEVIALNRKQRTKMSASKGTNTVTRVIMQEGIYTFETWGEDNTVAEPVVYMIDQHVIGGFYRLHQNKGADESLNAPGMHFQPLQFQKPCTTPDKQLGPDECPNRFYAYGVVARLSMLAAAREKDLAND
ncbi:MAG: glutamate--cysteine ligase [Gammaproteobacteria bacterium]